MSVFMRSVGEIPTSYGGVRLSVGDKIQSLHQRILTLIGFVPACVVYRLYRVLI